MSGCFLGEPVKVPVQSEPVTITPPGLGLSLKIPHDALQDVKDGNQQLNVSLRTCLSGPAFKYIPCRMYSTQCCLPHLCCLFIE